MSEMKINQPTDKAIIIGEEVFEIDPTDFSIDTSDIDIELCNMAQLLMSYGHVEARAKIAMEKADADMDFVQAICYNEAKESAEGKVTVDQLRNSALIDQRYQDAVAYSNFTIEQHARARWAVVALQAKAECLRTVAYRDNRMNKFQYE